MYSFQGHNYTSLKEVPGDILFAFIQNNVLTETIAIQQNKILFWEEHYLRLMASMRILRMEIPLSFTLEHLSEKIIALTTTLSKETFNGRACLNVVKMAQPTPGQAVPPTAYSITAIPAIEREETLMFKTTTQPIDLYKDHYLSTGLYTSLQSAAQQWRHMAWTYVHENDYCDGILLNTEKHLVETLSGALFLIKGNQISTPSLDQGVRKSVYRKQLLSVLSKSKDFEITEDDISPFSIQKADELFVLEDAQGIYSISQYRKKKFKATQTEKIWAMFLEYVSTQNQL
jgi:branched-chain amino acid aminotransferase